MRKIKLGATDVEAYYKSIWRKHCTCDLRQRKAPGAEYPCNG